MRQHQHHRHPYLPFGFAIFLSFLEGIESGFATTTGIVVGLWFHTQSRQLLVITATLSLLINAVNSAAIKFSSEHATDESDGREKRRFFLNALSPALTQLITHVVMSAIVLLPIVLIQPIGEGILSSIALTIVVLFTAGVYRGSALHSRKIRDGLEMTILGLLIIAIGAWAGWILR